MEAKICFLSFLAYYFLKLHLHNFSYIKSHKEVPKQSKAFLIILLDDRRVRLRTVFRTNGSGSMRPKNIRNTALRSLTLTTIINTYWVHSVQVIYNNINRFWRVLLGELTAKMRFSIMASFICALTVNPLQIDPQFYVWVAPIGQSRKLT